MIQEILVWEHPYLVDNGDVLFTDEENLAMLRLPRKECELTVFANAISSEQMSCQTLRHLDRHIICT